MECKNLIKRNANVYMIDNMGVELDLENDFDIQKYEKANEVNVIEMVNNFLEEKDNNFTEIITTIEKMVQLYHIDYFMWGEGKQVSPENVAVVYNLKNRNSCVDCILKIFYEEKDTNDSTIKCMIEFSKGSSGDDYGFSFYRYFNANSFYIVKEMLKEYFQSDSNGNKDQKVVNSCIRNIQERLKYYYS